MNSRAIKELLLIGLGEGLDMMDDREGAARVNSQLSGALIYQSGTLISGNHLIEAIPSVLA